MKSRLAKRLENWVLFRWGFLLALGAVSLSAAAEVAAPPPTRTISSEDLRKDLDVIWDASEQGDPAFDRYRSRRDLEHAFEEARAQLTRPMGELQFYRIVAPAVAALGNGHAQLSLSPRAMEWLTHSAPLLPLGLKVVSGRLFVVRDLSSGEPSLAGAEVLAINDVRARELIRASIRSIALDGVSRTPRENAIGGWPILYDLVRLHDMGPAYRLAVRQKGAGRVVELKGRTGGDIVRDWRRQFPDDPEVAGRAPAKLTIDGDLAVMRIPHWDQPVDGQPGLSEQFATWFAQLDAAHTGALVIDVRNNGGGAEPLATELLSYLSDRPFRYYRCLSMNATDFPFLRFAENAAELRREIPSYVRPASPDCRASGSLELTETAFPNLGVQPPRQPHFRGRVYLLVNSQSFSTSSEFASAFHALGAGTIVGQETSGGYLGDSSGIEVTLNLPATGMTFNATMIAYHMEVPRHSGAQGGVVPDVIIRPRIDDLVSGRDLEMAAVRRLEARRRH